MDGTGPQVSGDDLISYAYGHGADPVRISHRVNVTGRINICLHPVTEMSSVCFLQAGPVSISQRTHDHGAACSWSMTTR